MTFTANETVGAIAAQFPGATREFEKLGIDYCCGGTRTLGEACAAVSVPIEEVFARIQNSLAATPSADRRNWQDEMVADLIAHIKNTHHVFVRTECPRIDALVAKVVAAHGANHPDLLQLQEVFSALQQELHVHLMKEEQVLFPYVVRMEEGSAAGEPAPPSCFGTVANPIRMMLAEHDGAGEALRALRSITKDYKVPEDACASYRALYDALQGFEADLHQHIHLENNILFPRSLALEARK